MTEEDESRYEVLASGGPEAALDATPERPARRRPTGRAIGIGSLALAVLAGGAVYASARSGSAGDEPESVLPRTAFAFAKVDLAPGGGQRDALAALARRFPRLGAQTADAVRDRAVTALTASLHLDYAKDVQPWLGRRGAIAGFPGTQGRPQIVVALQVTDANAALAALARTRQAPAAAQHGDYVVLAKDKETLDAAWTATGDKPLAKDGDFAADLGRLAGPQVALVWSDNSAAADAMLYGLDHPDAGQNVTGMSGYEKQVRASMAGRTVLGLHATSTYAEIAGYTVGRAGAVAAGRTDTLRALPATTIGAGFAAEGESLLDGASAGPLAGFGMLGRIAPLSIVTSSLLLGFTNAGGYASSSVSCTALAPAAVAAASAPVSAAPAPQATATAEFTAPPDTTTRCASYSVAAPEPPGASRQAPAMPSSAAPAASSLPPADRPTGEASGFPMHEERAPEPAAAVNEFAGAVNGGTTFVLGSLPTPGTKQAPDLALISSTKDPGRAEALAAKVKEGFSQRFTGTPYSQVKDGELTLASSAEFAGKVRGGDLGKTQLFHAAMGDLGDQVEVAVFANLEGVRDVVPGYPKEWLPVSAVGLSSRRNGDVSAFRVRIVAR